MRCNNTGACLSFWKGCNGIDDCGDASDEANCKTGYNYCPISLTDTQITIIGCSRPIMCR